MSQVTHHIFLILFFISTSIAPTLIASDLKESKIEKKPFFFYRTHVYIRNDLGESDRLQIHCKSKNDDLGVQTLLEKTSFQWRFRINFFMTTLFWCNFSWRDGTGGFVVFDADRDLDRCRKNCTWSAQLDGLHGYNQRDGRNDITFPWVV